MAMYEMLFTVGGPFRSPPINRTGADATASKKASTNLRRGAGGKTKFSDEEIRRWRKMHQEIGSVADVHRLLTDQGVSVARQYLSAILRGDLRPFA